MSRELTRALKKGRERMLKIQQTSWQTLSTAVHGDTPRDTGAAQDSWTARINGVSYSMRGGNFGFTTSMLRLGQKYEMTSDLPYIRALEYGHSKQAPAGMVRINCARWASIVNHAASQVL